MPRLLLALLVALLAPAALAQPCTTSWANAAGGAWTTAANWDAGVPDAADVACITLPGTYTVTVGSFDVSVLRLGAATGTQTLVKSSGTFSLATGSVAAGGVFEWRDGYLTAGTFTNAGLVRFAGGGGNRGVNTNGAVFRNTGTVTWSDGQPFYLFNNGARAENAGLWDTQGGGDLFGFGAASNGGSTFVNEATGTFRRTLDATANLTQITVTAFTNAGTVDAQAGTIRFDGATAHTAGATLTASAGATVDHTAATAFAGAVSGSPAGTVQISAPLTASAGATWTFGGTGLTWRDGYLTAGTLTNAGLVRLAGGGTGRGVNANGAVFRNAGTVTWTDGQPFYLYSNGARAENAGLWDAQAGGDLFGFGGVTNDGGLFVNEATGTFRRSVDGSANLVQVTVTTFTNAGTVDAQAGAVQFDAASSHTAGATLTASTGATVDFASGGVAFAGAIAGSPAGTVQVRTAVTSTGATWTFGGTGLTWRDGYLTAGTLTNAGLVRLAGGGTGRGVNANGAVFRNAGTVTWTDGQPFYLYSNGARAENAGLWDAQAGGDLFGFGGVTNGGSTFVNEATGTLRRTLDGSVNLTQVTVTQFANAGTVDAQAGTIQFSAGGSVHTDAVLAASAGAAVEFTSGTLAFAGTTTGAPAGTVRITTPFTSVGGTWNVGGTGVEWGNGYLTAGTLTNNGLVRLAGAGGTNRGVNTNGAVFRNAGTVTWTDGQPFYLFSNGARAENAGLWDAQSTGDLLGFGGVTNGGSVFVNEAAGTFQRSVDVSSNATQVTVTRFDNAGAVRPLAGAIDVDAPFDHQAGARVEGRGAFDRAGSAPFTHAGDTSPGSPGLPVGTLSWSGPYTPAASASLVVDLTPFVGSRPADGLGAPDSDVLVLSNGAVLAGALVLRTPAVGSFGPARALTVGDAFTVVTATGGTIAGTFAAVTGPPGFAFSVAYTATTVAVTVTAVGVSTQLAGAAGWRMLAPAVTGSTVNSLVGTFWTQGFPGSDYPPAPQANVVRYQEPVAGNQQLGYVAPGNQSDALALGTGIFAYVYADDDFSGPAPPAFPKTLLQSGADVAGPFAFPLTYTATASATDDGWNIAGNPYAATMNWADPAWTRTNVESTLYVWDPATAGYLSHNTVTGSLPGGLVAPAQGFWVHATGAPTLTSPATARTTGGAFVGRPTAAAVVELRLAPADAASPLRASAFVAFADGASDGQDVLDGYELAPLAQTALALWTGQLDDGDALDIQTLAPADAAVEVPVGVAAWADGQPAPSRLVLTWPALPDGVDVSLRDVATGTVVDLRQDTSYAFTLVGAAGRPLPAGPLDPTPARLSATAPRFVLVVGRGAVGTDGGAGAVTALLAPAPNPTVGRATVRWTLAQAGPARVTVLDMTGREVAVLATGDAAAGPHAALLDAARLAAGVYVVRLQSGAEVQTRRLTVVR